MADESLAVELPPMAESARAAREALAEFRGHLDDGAYRDLELLVSELVADAVGADPRNRRVIKLRIGIRDEWIHVSLLEGAEAYRLRSTRPKLGEAGWGIHLLPMLADSWGTRHVGGRALVWVRMPVAGA